MSVQKKDCLSEKKLEELKEAFEIFDRDGNGCISLSEFATVLRALGQNPTEKELKQMLKDFDTNKTNSVEFEEFARLYHARVRPRDKEANDIRNAFKVFDPDEKGYITIGELIHVMSNIDQSESRLTEEEILAVITEADADNDGKIDYDEFSRFLCGN